MNGVRRNLTVPVLATMAALILGLTPTAAQDEEGPTGWKDSAELSYVLTSGNSDTTSLGFSNKLWRRWEKSAFELRLGGIRAQSRGARFATCQNAACDAGGGGAPGGQYGIQEPDPDLTAESYFFTGQYDRTISKRLYWFVGAGWLRNQFAGIQDRYTAFGGVGNDWVDKEKMKWKTDYAVSYTKQDDVIEDPTSDDSFVGVRIASDYWQQVAKTTTYGNEFAINLSVEETSDFQAVMTNWVAVSMTEHLALKVNLAWLYFNEPALAELNLLNTGGTVIGTVLEPLDKLDTIFTASLVINF